MLLVLLAPCSALGAAVVPEENPPDSLFRCSAPRVARLPGGVPRSDALRRCLEPLFVALRGGLVVLVCLSAVRGGREVRQRRNSFGRFLIWTPVVVPRIL